MSVGRRIPSSAFLAPTLQEVALSGRNAVNVAHPGNAHLIVCVCSHGPDDHVADAGCIALVQVRDDWTGGTQSLGEDFCPCSAYEVAP